MSRDNIVVYRLIPANREPAENFSYSTMMSLIKLGIVRHRTDLHEVIREGNTTVTIYYHEKV